MSLLLTLNIGNAGWVNISNHGYCSSAFNVDFVQVFSYNVTAAQGQCILDLLTLGRILEYLRRYLVPSRYYLFKGNN